VEEIILAQENTKKTRLSSNAGMEVQPLKEALPESVIPSTVMLSALGLIN
jgi:hypothetical protein